METDILVLETSKLRDYIQGRVLIMIMIAYSVSLWCSNIVVTYFSINRQSRSDDDDEDDTDNTDRLDSQFFCV